jgi:hypothetical protein
MLRHYQFTQASSGKMYGILVALHLVFVAVLSALMTIVVSTILRDVPFCLDLSLIFWQVFYFLLLVLGVLSGLSINRQTLFPEDMHILTMIPCSQRQLSVLVFSEHLISLITRIMLYFIIPIGIPLVLNTKEHLSLGMLLLTTVFMTIAALLIGFLVGLMVRVYRLYVLQKRTLLRTLSFQTSFTIMTVMSSYALISIVGNEWANLALATNVAMRDGFSFIFLRDKVASLGNSADIAVLFQYPYNIFASNVHVHTFSYLNLGLVIVLCFSMLFVTSLSINSFNNFNKFNNKRMLTKCRIEKLAYEVATSFPFKSLIVQNLFRKNLLLLFRHTETIQSSITALFGSLWIWVVIGILIAIKDVVGPAFIDEWDAVQVLVGTFGTVVLCSLLTYTIFHRFRFLLSIDGEGRNISLLKLGKVPLKNLYISQLNLLRVAMLPAFFLASIIFIVLGMIYEFRLEVWLLMALNVVFVFINLPKILLLGSVLFPRFEVAHFAESGQYLEQRITDDVGFWMFLVFAAPMFLIPGALDSWLALPVVSILYGTIMAIINYGTKIALEELENNIRHAESIL